MELLKPYILDENRNPISCNDPVVFGRFLKSKERIVGSNRIDDSVHVSTVFLGLDHNFSGKGLPILWETMVFGGEHDGYCERYSSEKEAKEGHNFAVCLVLMDEPKVDGPKVTRKYKLEE